MMDDQYDCELPDDLVILPWFDEDSSVQLTEDEIRTIDKAVWYEAEHPEIGRVLLCSAESINYLSEDSLEDATGVNLQDCIISRVDACLHRWNIVDGFYHA